MKEILEFVFQSFWHWLGTFLLLGTIFNGSGNMFGRKKVIVYNRESEEKK